MLELLLELLIDLEAQRALGEMDSRGVGNRRVECKEVFCDKENLVDNIWDSRAGSRDLGVKELEPAGRSSCKVDMLDNAFADDAWEVDVARSGKVAVLALKCHLLKIRWNRIRGK